MKYLLNIIVIILLSACGSDVPQYSKLSSNDVILAFGDSLTHGLGAKDNESYPAVLEALSGRKVINAGVSGEVSDLGLARLPEALEEFHPKLLILCHGGNDFLRSKSTTKMESNVRQMIQMAKDKNIPVLLLGVPKPGIFLSTSDVYKNIADSTNVVFIKDLVLDILKDNSLKSDSVHPNKDGYRIMAETIYSVLQDSGLL
jgi:lysophospholipase L1-like esterase